MESVLKNANLGTKLYTVRKVMTIVRIHLTKITGYYWTLKSNILHKLMKHGQSVCQPFEAPYNN